MSAGYDISASRSESTAQSGQLAAPTIINFKGWVDGGMMSQENDQTPTSVAARNAGDTSGATEGNSGSVANKPNWLLIGGIALAGIVAVVLVVKLTKKGSE